MGATSVTGTGRGAADGFNRGSEHQTLGVAHLIGPRVVAAGFATLTSGSPSTVTIQLDPENFPGIYMASSSVNPSWVEGGTPGQSGSTANQGPGTATLSASAGTSANYVVLVTNQTTQANPVKGIVQLWNNSDGTQGAQLVFTGPNSCTDVVSYAVVKTGVA